MSTEVGKRDSTKRFDFALNLLSQKGDDRRLTYFLDLLQELATKKLAPPMKIEDAEYNSLKIGLAEDDNVSTHMTNRTFLDTSTYYTTSEQNLGDDDKNIHFEWKRYLIQLFLSIANTEMADDDHQTYQTLDTTKPANKVVKKMIKEMLDDDSKRFKSFHNIMNTLTSNVVFQTASGYSPTSTEYNDIKTSQQKITDFEKMQLTVFNNRNLCGTGTALFDTDTNFPIPIDAKNADSPTLAAKVAVFPPDITRFTTAHNTILANPAVKGTILEYNKKIVEEKIELDRLRVVNQKYLQNVLVQSFVNTKNSGDGFETLFSEGQETDYNKIEDIIKRNLLERPPKYSNYEQTELSKLEKDKISLNKLIFDNLSYYGNTNCNFGLYNEYYKLYCKTESREILYRFNSKQAEKKNYCLSNDILLLQGDTTIILNAMKEVYEAPNGFIDLHIYMKVFDTLIKSSYSEKESDKLKNKCKDLLVLAGSNLIFAKIRKILKYVDVERFGDDLLLKSFKLIKEKITEYDNKYPLELESLNLISLFKDKDNMDYLDTVTWRLPPTPTSVATEFDHIVNLYYFMSKPVNINIHDIENNSLVLRQLNSIIGSNLNSLDNHKNIQYILNSLSTMICKDFETMATATATDADAAVPGPGGAAAAVGAAVGAATAAFATALSAVTGNFRTRRNSTEYTIAVLEHLNNKFKSDNEKLVHNMYLLNCLFYLNSNTKEFGVNTIKFKTLLLRSRFKEEPQLETVQSDLAKFFETETKSTPSYIIPKYKRDGKILMKYNKETDKYINDDDSPATCYGMSHNKIECGHLIEKCLENGPNQGENIEGCKDFMSRDDFFTKVDDEVMKMSTIDMQAILQKLGVSKEKVYDSKQNKSYYRMIEYETWCIKINNQTQQSLSDTDKKSITGNVKLAHYIKSLIKILNSNKCILNENYSGNDSSDSINSASSGNSFTQKYGIPTGTIKSSILRQDNGFNTLHRVINLNLTGGSYQISSQNQFSTHKMLFGYLEYLKSTMIKKGKLIDNDTLTEIHNEIEKYKQSEEKMGKLFDVLTKFENIVDTYGADATVFTFSKIKELADTNHSKMVKLETRKNHILEHLKAFVKKL